MLMVFVGINVSMERKTLQRPTRTVSWGPEGRCLTRHKMQWGTCVACYPPPKAATLWLSELWSVLIHILSAVCAFIDNHHPDRAKYHTTPAAQIPRECRYHFHSHASFSSSWPLSFGNIHYALHLCIRLRTLYALSYLILITGYRVNASRLQASFRLQAHQILFQGYRMNK